jgi:hypothetical protein
MSPPHGRHARAALSGPHERALVSTDEKKAASLRLFLALT